MAMRRSRNKNCGLFEVEPLVHLWLLRILVPLGAHREFISKQDFNNDSLAEVINLEHWVDPIDCEFNSRVVRRELRELYKSSELKNRNATSSGYLKKNISYLSKLVGLSSAECKILEFVILLHNEEILDTVADWLGNLSTLRLFRVLAEILDLPEKEIRHSLSANSTLAASGLVSIDRTGANRLRQKIDLLSNNFADNITSSDSDPISLLRNNVFISSPPQLNVSDFQYLSKELNILQPYLQNSLVTGRKGVNILIYGIPGTGKTQLAKVLAEELKHELFEVASEDEEGDSINGEERLRAFWAAQSFLAKRKSIILFDEIEDVFNGGGVFLGKRGVSRTGKAWFNRVLEGNPIPTLWLSNSIDGLDAAFIRRFDMICELTVPPKRQRQQIIRKSCADLLNKKVIDRISNIDMLAPAVVTRAASVIESIKNNLGQDNTAAAFELIVSNTLAAQGHKRLSANDATQLPETYDAAYINSNDNVKHIAAGLKTTKSGRLCLYGPPGTGKTAYGRWLAEELGMPLLAKRGSDLISMWVGGTEENIAKAFSEAESDGALLLIDEIEGFLQDRRGTKNSWEITGVNEMLVQMETFSGIFVASTNLINCLDQAALRRFDLKLHFDFLDTKQAGKLFKHYCLNFNLGLSDSNIDHRLSRLTNLTPGDFAAIARRHKFKPILSGEEMLQALKNECSLKEESKPAIGFI